MFTLAIANHKGGVGKTATAHVLGAALAEMGQNVLLMDLDPQASLTGACGAGEVGASLADVLGGATPGRVALRDTILQVAERLYLAPSDISLATTELGLTSRLGRENVVRKALATVGGAVDVCIVDCPPSLGLLTVGGLVAANAVLIPTQPQAVDLRGLGLFLDTIAQIREELNPNLLTLGVLVTFFDGRLIHHKEAVAAMERAKVPLLPVRVGRSVRVAEAAGAGESVLTWEPRNPRAQEYIELAEYVAQWRNEHRI